jgi:transcription termination factor Rho
LSENTLKQVWLLRRMMNMIDSDSSKTSEAMAKLLERMRKTKNNGEFLSSLGKES